MPAGGGQAPAAGVVSTLDLAAPPEEPGRHPVEEAMIHESLTVTPTTSLEEPARLMHKHHLSAVPVVENGELAALIQTSDVLALRQVSAAPPGSFTI